MRQRIVTGVLAGALFVALTIAGGWFYTGLLILLAIIGFTEYVTMNGFRWHHPASLLGYAGVLLFVLPWDELGVTAPSVLTIIWMLAFLLLAVTVITKNRTTIDGAALMLLGALYVGYGFAAMNEVRQAGEDGLFWTFLAFGCIWASDIGAYFVGRALGRTKLWPSISPNKTIEGAAGGILLALVVAVIGSWMEPSVLELPEALMFGLLAAIAGQFGDLIQSAYKRVRDIKDTGKLLPGHGGVLDRCDSWIIVFPLLVLVGLLPT
ncbi:phosphatidate cytidylyltransferase [Paenibacillus sp. GCM10023252]|uniref:phosphatidate cytidylyltransferase n=1 Tax=Paenibacillus sp. GCM10023252 TaxID=3252649 RepID=UPI003610F162